MIRALLLVALLLSPTAALAADSLVGKVVGVTDGDTITVLVEQQTIKVRLAEIDTPESGQPWGNRAKQALRSYPPEIPGKLSLRGFSDVESPLGVPIP